MDKNKYFFEDEQFYWMMNEEFEKGRVVGEKVCKVNEKVWVVVSGWGYVYDVEKQYLFNMFVGLGFNYNLKGEWKIYILKLFVVVFDGYVYVGGNLIVFLFWNVKENFGVLKGCK